MVSNTSNISKRISKTLLLVLAFISIIHINCDKDNNYSISEPEPPPYPVVLLLIDYEAAWSPDGRTIAYIHDDSIHAMPSGIYLIDTNGNNKRLLKAGFCSSPDWSPDGNWIVFSEILFNSSESQIYKIKTNGDSLIQLTFEDDSFHPSWSDNSDWIVYQKSEKSTFGKYCIWKMKSDGLQKTVIGCDTGHVVQREPHWSNNKIVHMRDTLDSEGCLVPNIFLMNTDGTQLEKVTSGNYIRKPKLSPYGNSIIFFKYVSIFDSEQQTWMINSNGSNIHQVSRHAGYPDWSPDGEKIVYSDTRLDNRLLWIMNKDGSSKKQLTY